MNYERVSVEPLCDMQMDTVVGGAIPVVAVAAIFDMWVAAVQGVVVVWGFLFF